MNAPVRFPDTPLTRRLALQDAFRDARVEVAKHQAAQDDLIDRIFRKDLPANSERLVDTIQAELDHAIAQKCKLAEALLDCDDDIRGPDDIAYEMKASIRRMLRPVSDDSEAQALGDGDYGLACVRRGS